MKITSLTIQCHSVVQKQDVPNTTVSITIILCNIDGQRPKAPENFEDLHSHCYRIVSFF